MGLDQSDDSFPIPVFGDLWTSSQSKMSHRFPPLKSTGNLIDSDQQSNDEFFQGEALFVSSNLKRSPDSLRSGEPDSAFARPEEETPTFGVSSRTRATVPFYRSLSSYPITNLAIVLDIDETCVHSFTNIKDYHRLKIGYSPDLRYESYVLAMNDVVSLRGQGRYTQMWGIRRPYIRNFLAFCFRYFKVVVVWSAGVHGYVHDIVDQLFADIIPPHAVFTRNDCTKIGDTHDKNLSLLYRHPELGRYMNATNTLILDDRVDSFGYSSPNNGVLIPEYKPELTVDQLRANDRALPQFKSWLLSDEVRATTDVRQLEKSLIFS